MGELGPGNADGTHDMHRVCRGRARNLALRSLAPPRASSQVIQRAGHALAALGEHMAAGGRCLQIRALWTAATAHFCRWAATASSNRSDMFIVHESKQNRLKPHRGGMVASGAVHAAPMELERILGCAVTINMSLLRSWRWIGQGRVTGRTRNCAAEAARAPSPRPHWGLGP